MKQENIRNDGFLSSSDLYNHDSLNLFYNKHLVNIKSDNDIKRVTNIVTSFIFIDLPFCHD
jgi:hypothetical protein